MIVECVLYRMRVGYPWRDLPSKFGSWSSIDQQFNCWSSKNKLMNIFKALIEGPNLEWEFVVKLPTANYTIADKGYDCEVLRQIIREKSSVPVIPRKNNSLIGNSDMDWRLYKYRHLVENLFACIKHFRAIATQYDKLKRNYVSMVALACGFLWLSM